MACGSCNKSVFSTSSIGPTRRSQSSIVENCEFTQEILLNWRNTLRCLKASGFVSPQGLSLIEINRYLGTVQSSINYPDNYCYYSKPLQDFQSLIPLIIENAPNCI
jgi:hypothetical protein